MYKEEYEAVPLSYASSGWRLDATRLTLEVVEAKFCNQLYQSSTRLYVSCQPSFFGLCGLALDPFLEGSYSDYRGLVCQGYE
jgi:hypothetical protein